MDKLILFSEHSIFLIDQNHVCDVISSVILKSKMAVYLRKAPPVYQSNRSGVVVSS